MQYKSDSVASGDMRPVTSNAVAGKFAGIGTILSYTKAISVTASTNYGTFNIGEATGLPAGSYIYVVSGRVINSVSSFGRTFINGPGLNSFCATPTGGNQENTYFAVGLTTVAEGGSIIVKSTTETPSGGGFTGTTYMHVMKVA